MNRPQKRRAKLLSAAGFLRSIIGGKARFPEFRRIEVFWPSDEFAKPCIFTVCLLE